MLPTADEIRALDGPALTRLAFELGLAPAEANQGHQCLWVPIGAQIESWEPHRKITQARTLFFALRDRSCIISFCAGSRQYAEAIEVFGRCTAEPMWRRGMIRWWHIEVLWGVGEPAQPPEATEALALLRCACLAVAAERREEGMG